MSPIKLLRATALGLIGVVAGLPPAQASHCMDSAEDAAAAFFTGGASFIACQTEEILVTIGQLVNIVVNLTRDVTRQATEVARAASGAVRTLADETLQAFNRALRELSNAQAQAQTVAARYAPGTGAAPAGAADPVQLRNALNLGAQRIGELEAAVARDVATRVRGAHQHALDQAQSGVIAASRIAGESLLAPLRAIESSLRDLLAHPERLFDPSATVNAQIVAVTNSITRTMSDITETVTRDAVATLQGVETDIRRAGDNADYARRLVDAMARAERERTQTALNNLNAMLPGGQFTSPTGGAQRPGVSLPSVRFDQFRARIEAGTAPAIAPTKRQTGELNTKWDAVKRLQAAKPAGVSPDIQRRAEAELDRLFGGKSQAEADRAKADLLARYRQRYAKDPRLVAQIEQKLNAEAAKRAVRTAAPPAATAPTLPGLLPDLKVVHTAALPAGALRPGQTFEFLVTVKNFGAGPAPGSVRPDRSTNPNGYMIDLTLNVTPIRDPVSPATISATFRPGMLLRGGRISVTDDLAPGAQKQYRGMGEIPSDTPPGQYWIGVAVDPFNKVAEGTPTGESDNAVNYGITVTR